MTIVKNSNFIRIRHLESVERLPIVVLGPETTLRRLSGSEVVHPYLFYS
jgi:hypothetical protein